MHTLTVFILVTLSVITLAALLWGVIQFYLIKLEKIKGVHNNKKTCKQVERDLWIRNHTSYFLLSPLALFGYPCL